MRVVRPIASIENPNQKDAYIALVIGVVAVVFIVACAVAITVNVVVSARERESKARIDACASYEQIDTRTDCVRRVG